MRLKSFLIFLLEIILSFYVASFPARAAEKEIRLWNIFANYDEAYVVSQNQGHLTPMPEAGVDLFTPFGLTFGVGFADYSYPFGPQSVQNSEVSGRLGLNLFQRKLQFVAKYNSVNSSYDEFSGGKTSGFGAEVTYRAFLTEGLSVHIMGGWAQTDSVTVTHETVTAVNSNALENYLCWWLTAGISHTCSTGTYQHLNIPQSSYWKLGIGIAYLF